MGRFAAYCRQSVLQRWLSARFESEADMIERVKYLTVIWLAGLKDRQPTLCCMGCEACAPCEPKPLKQQKLSF